MESLKKLTVGNFQSAVRKTWKHLLGLVYLYPRFVLLLILAFGMTVASKAHASEYYFQSYPVGTYTNGTAMSGSTMSRTGSTSPVSLSISKPHSYYSSSYINKVEFVDETSDKAFFWRHYRVWNASGYVELQSHLFSTSRTNPSYANRTDFILNNTFNSGWLTSNPGALNSGSKSLFAIKPDGNEIFFTAGNAWNTAEAWVNSSAFPPGTFPGDINRKNVTSGSVSAILTPTNTTNVDGFAGIYFCGNLAGCGSKSVYAIGRMNKNVGCFPVKWMATYGSVVGYSLSAFCPDTNKAYSFGFTYLSTESQQLLFRRNDFVYANTGSTAGAGKISICNGSGTVTHFNPLGIDNVAETYESQSFTTTSTPCDSLYLDKFWGLGIIKSGVATNSQGQVDANALTGLANIGISTLDAPLYTFTESCSGSTTTVWATFVPATMTWGTWSGSTLTFSNWIRISTTGTTGGSTDPSNLAISLVANDSSITVSGSWVGTAYNGIRLGFDPFSSYLYGQWQLNVGINSGWTLQAQNATTQFFAGGGGFSWTNFAYEQPVIKSFEIGFVRYETQTTTTCVGNDGSTRTITSTGTYVPSTSETVGTGSISSSGSVSLPDINTGNPVIDYLAEKILSPVKGILESTVGVFSQITTPFNESTPTLSIAIPAFTITSGGSSTINIDVQKKNGEFTLPQSRLDHLTQNGALKSPSFSNLEDSGYVKNAIAILFSLVYTLIFVALFGIFFLPVRIGMKATGYVSEYLDVGSAPDGGALSAVIKVAYLGSMTVIWWGLLAGTIAVLMPVFWGILAFVKVAVSFITSFVGVYPLFAKTANALIVAIPVGIVAVVSFRLLITYAKGR